MFLKDEVVEIMTNVINDMNRQLGWQNQTPSDQVDAFIEQMKPELNRVNGLLYDKLKEVGVIQ